MKILVKNPEGPTIRLLLPSGLILNRFAAGSVAKYLKDHHIPLTGEQAAAFIRVMNQYRRSHPQWVLAEVEGSDGTYVKVKV